VEIFCALLPKLAGDAASVDADIAAFESKRQIDRLRACSACTGDYEDPDRTAWIEEAADEENNVDEAGGPKDEFPVQCT
jgi:hypothetical protein